MTTKPKSTKELKELQKKMSALNKFLDETFSNDYDIECACAAILMEILKNEEQVEKFICSLRVCMKKRLESEALSPAPKL